MNRRGHIVIIILLIISIACVIIFGEYKDNKNSQQILLDNQRLVKTTVAQIPMASSVYDKISKKQTISILVLGDGQSSSESALPEDKWTTKVKLWLTQKYGVSANINIVAAADQNAKGALEGFKKLDAKSYDLVLICVGERDITDINFSSFKTSYEQLIKVIKSSSASTDIMTIVEGSIRVNTDYPSAIIALSKQYNLLNIDMRAEFKKSTLPYTKLSTNGVLPSKEGYNLYALAVENSIKNAIASSRKITP